MRSLRAAMVAVSAAGVLAGLAGAAATGCGSNNNTALPGDGGHDATGDVVTDTTQFDSPSETSSDSGSDGGSDTSVPEDSGDTGSPDAADASTAMQAFANAEVAAICQEQIAGCPPLDAGSYSLAACEAAKAGYGWEGNLPDDYLVFQRGKVNFDSAKAATCLAAIAALPTGTQTAAQWGAVTQACELVFTGVLSAGQSGCATSFECSSGTYCAPAADGGIGTCTALATQGQPCDTAIASTLNPIPDFMCSYQGSSNTGLFCNIIANSANMGTCQPLLTANASDCGGDTPGAYFDDQACAAASGGPLCGDLGCGTTASYPYPGWCQALIASPDAGAGDAAGD